MLVLTRRGGESIVIGDNIEITILSINGNKVRLGVNAPPSIAVNRQEVHERRQHSELVLSLSCPDEIGCAGVGAML